MAQSAPQKDAIRSMTGYAQARVEESGWTLRLSLRSVNHRFLDLHLRLPEGFEVFEPLIRQKIRDRVRRGHLEIKLNFEPAGSAGVSVNREVAAAYVEAAEALRQQFDIRTEPDLAAILRLPGVISAPALALDENRARFEMRISECLTEVLDRLDEMRRTEGRHLVSELSARLRTITAHGAQIERLVAKSLPLYAERLDARLKELLRDVVSDPSRLAQEAAIAAERSDATEELARLRSHIEQFERLLSGSSETGKKLDFLLQEMQRETNTLLSKTTGNGLEGIEITRLGLEVKAEIEKLREQVQNIE
ncbi:MAG: YicC/YloC family endoribonuclease [Candidatus Acidiferrales bacterium]